ncbi:copper resistance protein CopC [Bradyrhizobium sp. AUGA SZCCT0176]|uniref:copper resistance CopC/CopD family protein n=1 Tax=Bradyrhizobium sp. AUGA SZCCT0176 TaxID=2807664 RepID=UPI001BAC4D87|nr:copper resistance protein CopC [Bradyrhizobium sp. AUGA SZCCT0176]MBR1225555.1 copper resistance protein CopC [Bradyrhizobium sp. AUGA SZCCT0176]
MLRAIAAVAALLVALCFATDTFAHASLVDAEPADGSVVAEAPKTLQLQFNESVTPAVVNLIDAAGKTRAVTVRAVDQSVVIVLPDDLPRGTQVVSYRVVSQDGHPVAGSLVFSIGVATANTARSNGGPVAILIWLARIGVYVGLFAGVGGAFFAVWIGQGSSGALVITGALAVGVASAVASLGLQGLDLLDLPLGGLATSAPWTGALGTSLGPSLLIAIASMVIAGFAWRSPTRITAWALTVLAMAGVGLSLATSGHAATASPKSLTAPAMFLHGVAIAFWVGALAPLVVLARQSTGAVVPVLQRFSRLAVPVVGFLVLSGLGLAVIQLESFHALIDTRYGIILLVKLTLVTVLLGLAALNRYRLTLAVAADPGNTRPLIGSILIECVVVACILAVVATWRFTPPPRVLAAAAQAPLAIHIHTEKAMAQVSIVPGKVGSNDFVLQLLTGDFGELSAKEATLTLSLPERGIEPLEREAKRRPDGYWHVRGVPLPVAGRWRMRIDVLVTDFEKVTLEGEFDVR